MRKKMLKNASFLVIVAVFLSFVTASLVMYEKVRDAVKAASGTKRSMSVR